MYASFTSAVVSASWTCCVASRRIIQFIDDMTPLSASVSPPTKCLCACVVRTVCIQRVDTANWWTVDNNGRATRVTSVQRHVSVFH